MTSLPPPARGLLILIEGVDRSGKSTQVQLLTDALPALLAPFYPATTPSAPSARAVRFPDRTTTIGGIINTYLTSTKKEDEEEGAVAALRAAHNLFSANRWELVPELYRALRAAQSVVLDRYVYSGIAYSYAASRAHSNSTAVEPWLWASDAGLPVPDLVLFLTIDAGEAQARAGFGEERYEARDIQARVRAAYDDIIRPSHVANFGNMGVSPWVDINVSGLSIDQVHAQIKTAVLDAVQTKLERGLITARPPCFDQIIRI